MEKYIVRCFEAVIVKLFMLHHSSNILIDDMDQPVGGKVAARKVQSHFFDHF